MKTRIAMIDDDKDLSSLVKDAFNSEKFQIECAYTGADGIRLIEDLNPDLILLDIQLPDMSGWDVCERLRSHDAFRKVPIMMISGKFGLPEDKAKGLQMGADDYIDKPFSLAVLKTKIEVLLRK